VWINRQHKDIFVKKSKEDGYRSRAAYKLLELQTKYSLLKSGMTVIDLGAAPGSWSQVAIDIIAPQNIDKSNKQLGRLIAVDILPIEPIKNVDIILGDLTTKEVFDNICNLIGVDLNNMQNKKVDIILSDMAPNLSGIWAVDIPKAMYLSELAMDLVKCLLKKDGSFLIKLFNGEGFDKYLIMLRKYFAKVIISKPKSSRAESREMYVLARGYKLF
jgi:23S rRNA (uridine2552-2'-O)-methyltransferase